MCMQIDGIHVHTCSHMYMLSSDMYIHIYNMYVCTCIHGQALLCVPDIMISYACICTCKSTYTHVLRELRDGALLGRICNKKGRMYERVAREKGTPHHERHARLTDAEKCFEVCFIHMSCMHGIRAGVCVCASHVGTCCHT